MMNIVKLNNSVHFIVIVKASSGPRYVVGVQTRIDKKLLKVGTRVTLDMTTLTIMRVLPREVDPQVHNMISDGKQISLQLILLEPT